MFPLLLKCVYVCKTARQEHFFCANTFSTFTTTTDSHKNQYLEDPKIYLWSEINTFDIY